MISKDNWIALFAVILAAILTPLVYAAGQMIRSQTNVLTLGWFAWAGGFTAYYFGLGLGAGLQMIRPGGLQFRHIAIIGILAGLPFAVTAKDPPLIAVTLVLGMVVGTLLAEKRANREKSKFSDQITPSPEGEGRGESSKLSDFQSNNS